MVSTRIDGVLTEGTGDRHLVVAAPADRTAGQDPSSELLVANGTVPSQLDQAGSVDVITIEGKDRARFGMYVDDVVVPTAILVGPLERPPPGRERQATITAGQIAEVRHPERMALRDGPRCH
ncbi:MAG: hypothetical protein QOG16_1655 [Actinomycetota bacterium]|nr:hypothetical protein [Actinomycetota bacterium]